MTSPAPIALSLGDPAGIGPEIVVAAWRALRGEGPVFAVVGDAATLVAVPGARVQAITRVADAGGVFADALPVLDSPLASPAIPGRPTAAAADRIIAWIETATRLALSDEASAVVTAPVAKALLYQAGFKFPGHTEFLGAVAPSREPDARGPIMMLAAGDLRVSLVTVHEPLARVPSLLTVDLIVNAGLITARALARDFAVARPRLAVTGLNPHAGESGTIGREEADVIAPAVAQLRARGVAATGPHPSDSLFHAQARTAYDAVLCMYHDQALIPVKMLDFWSGVNITLGLPVVRTSPDHGTGFDIAGRGVARPDSLIAALRLAARIAANRAAAA